MSKRTLLLSAVLLIAVVAVTAGRAWAISFGLGETKEELKLKYDVSVVDHHTGRVTIVFTLADEGRLKPLEDVELTIPDQEKNADGGHWMDLVMSMKMNTTDDGKRVGRIHLLKSLAERAEIRLNTRTKDGKLDPLTGLYYIIRISDYMNDGQNPAAPPSKLQPKN